VDWRFGRNVTNKVSSQKTLYCVTSITCASALPGKMGNTKISFCHSNALLISSIFWLTTHTDAAVWLPESCNQCVQLGAVGAMVQEKGSPECCSSWTVLHAQCTSALSSGFPDLQGSAETLDRWGWKTKRRIVSYFRSNTYAKNYRNRIVYVKIIASQRWDVFLTHSLFIIFALQRRLVNVTN